MKCISLLLIQKFSFRNGKRKENHSSADVIVSRNEQASICSSKYKAKVLEERIGSELRLKLENSNFTFQKCTLLSSAQLDEAC